MPLSSRNVENSQSVAAIIKDLLELPSAYTDGLYSFHAPLEALREKLRDYNPTLHIAFLGHDRCGKSSLLNSLVGDVLLPINESEEDEPETCFKVSVMCGVDVEATAMLRDAEGETLAVGRLVVRDWLHHRNKQHRDHLVNLLHLQRAEEIAHHEAVLAGVPPPPSSIRGMEIQLHPVLSKTPLCFREDNIEIPVALVDTPRGTPITRVHRTPATAKIQSTRVTFTGDAFVYLMDYRLLKTDREDELFHGLVSHTTPPLESIKERFLFVVTNTKPLLYRIMRIHNVHYNDPDEAGERFQSLAAVQEYVLDVLRSKLKLHIRAQQVVCVDSQFAVYSRMVQPRDPPADLNTLYDYCELVFGSSYMQRIDTVPEETLRNLAAQRAAEDFERIGLVDTENKIQLLGLNAGTLLLLSVCADASLLIEHYEHVMKQAIPILHEDRAALQAEHQMLKAEMDGVSDKASKVEETVLSMQTELEGLISDSFEEFWRVRVEEMEGVLEGKGLEEYKARQAVSIRELTARMAKMRAFLVKYEHDRRYLEKKSVEEGSADERSSWEFLNNNLADFLRALEKDLLEHVLDVGQSFVHHLKDELVLFLPALIDLCVHRRAELVEQLHIVSRDVLKQTEEHTGRVLDLTNVCKEWSSTPFTAPDERLVNNFLRDLPSEAADLFLSSFNSHTVRSLPEPEAVDMAMREMVKGWRVALSVRNVFDVIIYDSDTIAQRLGELHQSISNYINQYKDALKAGITLQEGEIEESETREGEVKAQLEALPPLTRELHEAWSAVKASFVWDLETALAYAQEEGSRRTA